ncbi:glycosyltransferase family protein [Mangrovibacterium sp.]|uniref:glycosyltransferase family protein n=1 Tax=Mangrovibacterium sp. TaxID=1961364 RepID=UPI00356AA612
MKKTNIRILYAIQGTGNGHLARATEIVPLLEQLGNVDVLVSGIQGDLQLPFAVKYQFYGLSFIFGKLGGVSLWETVRRSRPIRFIRDLLSLPVQDYDLVICDFEPVTAWACKLRGKKCIGLSHQNAVLHHRAPKPSHTDLLGHLILTNYAPASRKYGFHFRAMDEQNYTPVIRSAIRNAKPVNRGHYTVYLPAFSNEEIEHILRCFPQFQWHVFSKHRKESYRKGSIWFRPVSLTDFTESFISCAGILCTAGFETPAEAIHMGKKLCVIPMKNQYEQACNAVFAGNMGIRVLTNWHDSADQLADWLHYDEPLQINYPDQTRGILEKIVLEAETDLLLKMNASPQRTDSE